MWFKEFVLNFPFSHQILDFPDCVPPTGVRHLSNVRIFVRMEKNDNQLNIELSEELAEGVYSNLAIITHSQAEFVTDFIQMMPGMPKAKVRSRVIMSPQNAKRLMRALAENIQKYEQANGVITDTESTPFPPMNFGGPATQA